MDQGAFAKSNAYATVGLSGFAIIVLSLAIAIVAVSGGSTWMVIVLGLILVTVLGGPSGWGKIASSISEAVSHIRKPKE